ncbi:MAG: hypothetical protein K6G03_10785, partial [Lachnospiraceae bacterium]|nr:hypothetical protein [Lachnospiraceae bacterium]
MEIFKEAKIAKITKIAMIAKVAKIAKAEMMAKAAMMAKVAMTTAVIFILCILGGCGKETEGPASGAGVAAGTATDTPNALSVDTSTASFAGDAEMSDLINTKEVAVGAGAGGDRKMSESGDGSGSNTEEGVSSDAKSGNSVSSDAVSSDALNSDAGDNTMRTDEEAKGDFYVSEISDEIFAKMQGKSFKADCKTARSDLR